MRVSELLHFKNEHAEEGHCHHECHLFHLNKIAAWEVKQAAQLAKSVQYKISWLQIRLWSFLLFFWYHSAWLRKPSHAHPQPSRAQNQSVLLRKDDGKTVIVQEVFSWEANKTLCPINSPQCSKYLLSNSWISLEFPRTMEQFYM